jgi:hypothetical protein
MWLEHPRTFWRGARPGAIGGAALGFLAAWSLVRFPAPYPSSGALAWAGHVGLVDELWPTAESVWRAAVALALFLGAGGALLLGAERVQREHGDEPGSPRPCPWAARAGRLLAALLLTLMVATIPNSVMDANYDPSWRAVLVHAHEHGLQFGTDLVFTYGPLGFLTVTDFSPHVAAAQLIASLALGFVVSLGVCLVAWRLSLVWRWLLLLSFAAWSFPSPLGPDVMVQAGLLCWGMLCLAESGPRLWRYTLTLVLLCVFAALTKISLLPVAGLTIVVVACDLAARRRWALALMLAPAFAASGLIVWMAFGQRLAHLPAFLGRGWAVSSEYNLAGGYVQGAGWEWFEAQTALCAGVTILFRALTAYAEAGVVTQLRRGLLWLWSCAQLFVAWKHGVIVADAGHVCAFLGFVPPLALAFGALPASSPTAGRWGRGMAVACCCYVFASPLRDLGDHLNFLSFTSWRLCAQHLENVLRPTEYQREMTRVEEATLYDTALPRCRRIIGAGTVDVFGWHQPIALHNGLNYRPRPVFQSPGALSLPLMRLNEQFYLAPATAPDYVLFRLCMEGCKFPPLEDALLLRLLLQNYEPVEAEGPFLLLKARSAAPARLTLLREGTARPGEPIGLTEFGEADTWLEIKLEPTHLGRLRQFLYRPPRVLIEVEEPGSRPRQEMFWAPARMLEAGFLASPLVRNNQDALRTYAGAGMARPTAYRIDPDSARWFYRAPFHYRLYKIENRLGRCLEPDLAARLKPIVARQLLLLPDGIRASR